MSQENKIKHYSLLHMSSNISNNQQDVEKNLRAVNKRLPTYKPLFGYVRDMIFLKMDIHAALYNIEHNTKIDNRIRGGCAQILAGIHGFFIDNNDESKSDGCISFFPLKHSIGYSIGSSRVTLEIPFIYIRAQQKYVPCFIFWGSKKLDKLQMDFLATLLNKIIAEHPELDDAKIQIISFYSKRGKRQMEVIDADNVATLSDQAVTDLLNIYMTAFDLVNSNPEEVATKSKKSRKQIEHDPRQMDMFSTP